jgi:hypothetical protein
MNPASLSSRPTGASRLIRNHRRIAASVAIAVLLLVCLLLIGRGNASISHPDPVGPTVYSKSAIGHAAFYSLLDDLQVPVSSSETGSGSRLAPDSVLVIAEPRSDPATLEEVQAMLSARAVLLVLPKRSGEADPKRPNWLGQDRLVSSSDVKRVLQLVDPRASVVRVDEIGSWPPGQFSSGEAVIHPAQLIRSASIQPLLAGPEGVLVGEYRRGARRIIVLADPDPISNFGLARGGNAALAVHTIELLRAGAGGEVIFDEFVHGFADRSFHILGILFQFPFLLVTLQMAFAVLLLVWAASSRFGTPLEPPPAIDAGKRSLIETGARLLDRRGHCFALTERYYGAQVRDAGNRAHAPRGLDLPALLAWFSGTGAAAGLPSLPADHSDRAALLAARDVFVWRKGITGGPRTRTHSR